MTRFTRWIALALVLTVVAPAALSAHCQIPCGIYDDQARIASMLEDVTTIEKSIVEGNRLGGEKEKDWNQIVRWVMNKEQHADRLTETATYYFMAQRIKVKSPEEAEEHAKYVRELSLLHQIVVQAMKAKQNSDVEHCKKLRDLIEQFETSYLADHSH